MKEIAIMTPDIKPLVAGNWKMNGSCGSQTMVGELVTGFDAELSDKLDMAIFPPAILMALVGTWVANSAISVGTQDCHAKQSGAHTGDTAAEMIASAEGTMVLAGHSERRVDHNESDANVAAKTEAAWRAGLVSIICIGELEAERRSGKTLEVLGRQLAGSIPDGATASNTIIAYEPVWAIGTGLVPETSDVEEAHAFIRKTLADRFGGEGRLMRILYGGSVKPANAAELMAINNVDGALVGGASLKSKDFLGICEAYRTLA
jgi:triosephosphate isomerase